MNTLPKGPLAGVAVNADAATPVPLTTTINDLFDALLATEMLPVTYPNTVGV
jgi:hypothetical protein